MRLIFFMTSILFMVNPQSLYKMIVTWGTPQSFTTYTTLSLGWAECLQYCLNATNCVVVSNQTANKCLLFGIGQINTVKQTNSSGGVIVGFKMLSNESSCPVTDDAPIVNGSPGTGGVADASVAMNQTYQTYSVTASSGLWTVSAQKKLYCGLGGNIFERKLGPWCIWTYYSIGGVNQATAATKCATNSFSINGVLSGIESVEEYNFIIGKARNAASSSAILTKYATVGFWLGGTRRSECMAPNNKSAECNGSNEFSISDPTFTPPGYYDWLAGQPSGINTNPTTKNCLEIKMTSTTIGVDDVLCSATSSGTTYDQWGLVCGKKPT